MLSVRAKIIFYCSSSKLIVIKVFNGVDCDQIGIFLLLCRIFPCENILSVSIFVPRKERAVLVVWSAARLGRGVEVLTY